MYFKGFGRNNFPRYGLIYYVFYKLQEIKMSIFIKNQYYNVWIIIDCNSGQFRCDNGKCIPQNYVIDGDNDCGDSSDEGMNTKMLKGKIS